MVEREAGITTLSTADGRIVYKRTTVVPPRYYEEDRDTGAINPIERDEIKGKILGDLCGRFPICSSEGARWVDRSIEVRHLYVCEPCAQEKNLRALRLNAHRDDTVLPCTPP